MASSTDKLTPLQLEVLRTFFGLEQGFFLTGGAALAGFYLHHRETTDLDLFTVDAVAFERGRHALSAVADRLGATLVLRQHAPGFQRHVLTREPDAVVVDLDLERVAQMHPDKGEVDGIRLDPLEEILINTLTTVLSRSEERDLVDLLVREERGHAVESALAGALAKDGGCTPAALAWALSQAQVPDGATLPAGVAPDRLRRFVADLVRRPRRAAAPPASPRPPGAP
jgi:hypothetical protein